jgi:hypothetical protein
MGCDIAEVEFGVGLILYHVHPVVLFPELQRLPYSNREVLRSIPQMQ